MSSSSRKNSVQSPRVANSSSRSSTKPMQWGGGSWRNKSAERTARRDTDSNVSSSGQRSCRASSTAFRSSNYGEKVCGAEMKFRSRFSESIPSSIIKSTSISGSNCNTPRGSAKGRQENSSGMSSRPNGRLSQRLEEELFSLILGRKSLADMRPDMYRLDLSRKEDLRLLYDAQHRVDPELVPITKRISPQNWQKMHKSHIFDLPPEPPATPTKPTIKRNDGLGSLARFILSAEAPTTSPGKGRRHRSCSADKNNLWLFGPKKNDDVVPPSPRHNTQRFAQRPRDNLGKDLKSLDPLNMEITPRYGVRSMKAVQAFERLQPKLMLPPKKQTSRITDAMRAHSAGSDNDIFGVRRRRDHMVQGICSPHFPSNISLSARSSEPYGLDVDDAALHEEKPYLGSQSFDKTKGIPRKISTPYGEEDLNEIHTPTRHRPNYHSRSSSRSIVPRSKGFVSHALSMQHSCKPSSVHRAVTDSFTEKGNRLWSPLVVDSDRVSKPTDASKEQSAVADDTMSQSVSLITFNELVSNVPDETAFPRTRTGRARVPGYSNLVSNILFGAGEVIVTPKRSPRTQMNSAQMHSILTWT